MRTKGSIRTLPTFPRRMPAPTCCSVEFIFCNDKVSSWFLIGRKSFLVFPIWSNHKLHKFLQFISLFLEFGLPLYFLTISDSSLPHTLSASPRRPINGGGRVARIFRHPFRRLSAPTEEYWRRGQKLVRLRPGHVHFRRWKRNPYRTFANRTAPCSGNAPLATTQQRRCLLVWWSKCCRNYNRIIYHFN